MPSRALDSRTRGVRSAIAGTESLEEALERLRAQAGGHVVVTRGAAGVILAGADLPPGQGVAKSPEVAAIDPVGAGDAFKAGLIACLMRRLDRAQGVDATDRKSVV